MSVFQILSRLWASKELSPEILVPELITFAILVNVENVSGQSDGSSTWTSGEEVDSNMSKIVSPGLRSLSHFRVALSPFRGRKVVVGDPLCPFSPAQSNPYASMI